MVYEWATRRSYESDGLYIPVIFIFLNRWYRHLRRFGFSGRLGVDYVGTSIVRMYTCYLCVRFLVEFARCTEFSFRLALIMQLIKAILIENDSKSDGKLSYDPHTKSIIWSEDYDLDLSHSSGPVLDWPTIMESIPVYKFLILKNESRRLSNKVRQW